MKNLCVPIRIEIRKRPAGARGAFSALLSSSEVDAGEAVLAGENRQGRLTLCCILQGQSVGSTARGANAETKPAESSFLHHLGVCRWCWKDTLCPFLSYELFSASGFLLSTA